MPYIRKWQEFFDGHAPDYMRNCFTRNTSFEVDFIIEELKLKPGASILDIGCGTGRHSIEFAKRGYKVTGVDLSPGMLAEAKSSADKIGVQVEWIQTDAAQFEADKQYDAAICLCEGSFGLLNVDDDPMEHDLAILRNISAALKPGAGFILTALNGFAKIRKYNQEDVESGKFDPIAMTEMIEEIELPDRSAVKAQLMERSHLPQELSCLMKQVGLDVIHIWGGTAGKWGRRKIDLDEIEIMVVSKKQ